MGTSSEAGLRPAHCLLRRGIIKIIIMKTEEKKLRKQRHDKIKIEKMMRNVVKVAADRHFVITKSCSENALLKLFSIIFNFFRKIDYFFALYI